MMSYYKLDENKNPVPTDTAGLGEVYGGNRHIGHTVVGNAEVSTVFLGIDHGFGRGEPILFETMIFGGEHNGYQERYCTWKEAEEGHKRAVELVSKS